MNEEQDNTSKKYFKETYQLNPIRDNDFNLIKVKGIWVTNNKNHQSTFNAVELYREGELILKLHQAQYDNLKNQIKAVKPQHKDPIKKKEY